MTNSELMALPAAWEFYLSQLAGRPASFMVDLVWRQHAPPPAFSQRLLLCIDLQQPDARGLSTEAEAPALFALEDQLVADLADQLGALYVGRWTGHGQRCFAFYLPASDEITRCLRYDLQLYGGYRWTWELTADPRWRYLQDCLLPGVEEEHLIRNRYALDELRRRQVALEQRHPVVHRFQVPDRRAGQQLLARLRGQTTAHSLRKQPEGTLILDVGLSHDMEPEELDRRCLTFARLAARYEGSYEGWRIEDPPAYR